MTKEVTLENLPIGFDAYQMKAYQNQLYFAGLKGNDVLVYKRTEKKLYELIFKLNIGVHIFPKQIHVFGKEILLIVGERESSYITNHLYRSLNAGKTWVKENLKNNLRASPIGFYNDISRQSFKTWIYSGSGQIQVLNTR